MKDSSLLLISLALEIIVRKVQADQEGLKQNGIHQLWVYADGPKYTFYTERKTEALLVTKRRLV
jgi:hypothetical protein